MRPYGEFGNKKLGVIWSTLLKQEVGQILLQISICLQKNFEIMACDHFVFDVSTACNPNEDVYLIGSWY